MGHPSYNIDKGEVLLDGINILELDVDERAKAGLFLRCNIQGSNGVTNSEFMRAH